VPAVPGAASGPANSTNGNYSVSWGASGGSIAVSQYKLFENNNNIVTVNSPTVSASVSGRQAGNYWYAVQACNSVGCSASSGGANVLVTAPTTPGAITGPANNATGAYAVSWGASSGTVSQYSLYENGVLYSNTTALSASVGSPLTQTPAPQLRLPTVGVDGRKVLGASQESVERALSVAGLRPDEGPRADARRLKKNRPGDYTERFRDRATGFVLNLQFLKGKVEVIEVAGAAAPQARAAVLAWFGLDESMRVGREGLVIGPSQDSSDAIEIELAGTAARYAAYVARKAGTFNERAAADEKRFEEDPRDDHTKRMERCIQARARASGAGTDDDIEAWCQRDVLVEVEALNSFR
jgi:hypothetical protein